MLAVNEALDGGYDEAILLTSDGLVADGSGENIFVVRDGTIYTPDLSTSILPGITRDTVTHIAQSLGYDGRREEPDPGRPLPGGRGVHVRHGGRGDAAAGDRRRRARRRPGDRGACGTNTSGAFGERRCTHPPGSSTLRSSSQPDPIGGGSSMEFRRVSSLPPYVFAVTEQLKLELRRAGNDVIDLGFGNPDLPSPEAAVEKLAEAAAKPRNHRYSTSRGIPKLRGAICDLYRERFGVELDPETQAVATIGAKEGLAHLMWVLVAAGRHGGRARAGLSDPPLRAHPGRRERDPGRARRQPTTTSTTGSPTHSSDRRPRPRALIVSFPHNPTTRVRRPRLHGAARGAGARQRGARRARLRLRRHLVRRLPAAFDPAGPRCRRGRGRDLLADEVVLDGRLARRLRARERAGARGAGAAQVLSRLRDLPADPDRLDRRAERGARLSRRGVRDLPQAPRRPLRRARRASAGTSSARSGRCSSGRRSRSPTGSSARSSSPSS